MKWSDDGWLPGVLRWSQSNRMMNLAVDCYRVSLIKRLKLVMHHFHSVLWFHVQIDSINQHLNEIGSLICDENFTIKILLAPHYLMIFTWANNFLNLCFATWKHFNWNSFRFESFYLEWNDSWNLVISSICVCITWQLLKLLVNWRIACKFN